MICQFFRGTKFKKKKHQRDVPTLFMKTKTKKSTESERIKLPGETILNYTVCSSKQSC